MLGSFNALRETILDIRRRLIDGATVESGIYAAENNPGDPISGYERTLCYSAMFGLEIETKGVPAEIREDEPAGREVVTEPAFPKWLTETPHESVYFLAMEEGGLDCQECQIVEMTRKEFLILKVYLAKLRGLAVPAAGPEGFKCAGGTLTCLWDELEPEEIAAVTACA